MGYENDDDHDHNDNDDHADDDEDDDDDDFACPTHDIERVRVAPGDSAGNTAAVYPALLLL